ncbi:hypothetical protein [Shewanella sp. GutDb-MelDb]|uniref:hypothetical protein n=1 Tax=Shewanella sp. GutDb-MelDb TaxID=2058316 RepID=UPI000C7A99A2|nr:hypothetical protein [Shewanella sp. GutDb-MelDb]PKG56395.1 hypothetical protein CXF82_15045 [Shewanella sp. GutDb-MelDb]
MRKLSYIALFIFGLLLGASLAYITLQKVIASRGGIGMHGFVATANKVLQQREITELLICSKLAMNAGHKIDNISLNMRLNTLLKPYDNGHQRAFYVLVYIKGYAFGVANSIKDKIKAYDDYACQTQYSWLLKQEH